MTAPALLLAALVASAFGDGPVESVLARGEAHDPSSGALLYTEEHRQRWRDGAWLGTEVRYVGADGTPWVTKWLLPRDRPAAPACEWVDHRSGRREAALPEGDRIALAWSEDGRERRGSAELPPGSAVDLGAQVVILESWERLIAGETVELGIAVPERLALYGFRLRRVDSEGGDLVTFELAAANFLVRLVLDPIHFTYSKRDRRIRSFLGRTGIADARGRPIVARVDYTTDVPLSPRPGP